MGGSGSPALPSGAGDGRLVRMTRLLQALGLLVLLVLGLSGLSGCRGCSDATESSAPAASAPTMPVGMLVPLPGTAARDAPASPAERLSIARGKKSGAWAELQVAPANDGPDRTAFERWRADSRFVPLEAMALLDGAFARALPGFDLFLPRLFDRTALGRLRAELATLRAQLATIPNAAAANERWGGSSSLIRELPDDAAWVAARTALTGTIDELSALASDLETMGKSLWVLGI